MPAAEWKYFMDDGEMGHAARRPHAGAYSRMPVASFDAGLKKKATPYEWGKDIAPGLLAVGDHGHTPGHTAFVLSSGSDKVFIQSDVTNHPHCL